VWILGKKKKSRFDSAIFETSTPIREHLENAKALYQNCGSSSLTVEERKVRISTKHLLPWALIRKLRQHFQFEVSAGSDSCFAQVWINFRDCILNAASNSSPTFHTNFTCMNVKSVTATPKELLYLYVDRFNFRCFTRMDYIHYNLDLHAQVI